MDRASQLGQLRHLSEDEQNGQTRSSDEDVARRLPYVGHGGLR